MTSLHFLRPWWLLALLPLALAAWQRWRAPHAPTPWRRVVDAHLLPHLLAGADGNGRRTSLWLPLAAWTCAVLGLAGPAREGAVQRDAAARDGVRVLVVDLSPQTAPQRERVQFTLHALLRAIEAGPHGETALLVYAEEPYLVLPPTADTALIARFIPELAPDAMPAAGNRPERALRMAAAVLARSGAATRDLVWITAGAASAAVLPAGLNGVRLSVLHAGMPPDDALKTAVEHSGGLLVDMAAGNDDVKKLADTMSDGIGLGAATRADGEEDLGYLLLVPLLPLAALGFRRGMPGLLALVVCAAMLPPQANAAQVSDLFAWRLFAQGRHAEAAQRFTDARWKAAAHYRAGRYEEAARLLEGIEEPDALYNRGNALARLGRLPQALDVYEAALRLRPDDADTVYNRDLVKRLLNRNSGAQGPGAGGSGGADAERVANQWLRSVPDDPGTLLRRKLQIEHQRRQSGAAERPW